MAKKTDHLIVKLEQDGAGKLKASLAGVSSEMDGLDRETSQTNKSLIGFKQIVGAIGFAALTKGLISANVEYQKMRASLKTVTGSQAAANREWAKLEKFTSTTPFQIEEVVQSFIKLKALGLDPSERSLLSYGNTASAMGKSLDQLIEAVADAATGEFERLKTFGIKTRQQGDEVSFTFRGVTTTVEKNATAIENYLRNIGETDFAGAVDEQMNTLGGAFSNFQDSIFRLSIAIGEAGVSDQVLALARDITTLSETITQFVNDPTSMPDWLKVTAFTARTLSKEFQDLGDWIGAVSAIVVKAVQFDFDAIDAVVAEREKRRAAMEKDQEQFVARLEGLTDRLRAGSGDNAPGSAAGAVTTESTYSEKEAKLQEHLQNRWLMLQQSVLNEQQLAQMKHEQDLVDLENAAFAVNASIEEENALKEELERQHQQRLTEIAEREAQKRAEAEQKVTDAVTTMRTVAFNQGVALLRRFADKNDAVALLLIALQTAKTVKEIQLARSSSVAQVTAYGEVAATLAYASQLIPGDPTSVVRAEAAAARVRTRTAASIGGINAAATIGTALAVAGGIADIAALNEGDDSPVAPGSPANPISTQPVDSAGQPAGSFGPQDVNGGTVGTTNVVFIGTVTDESVVSALQNALDNDVTVINQGTRQYDDIIEGARQVIR